MTRDEIIRMAVEAGATYYADDDHLLVDDLDPFDFADRVAAATREKCAQTAEAVGQTQLMRGRLQAGTISKACAHAIRAEGKP